MEVAAQSADDDAPQPRSSSSMEYAPASHRVDERQRRLHVGNADAERQPQSAHIAGETDNESARRPDTRQYVAASTGTGKSWLACALGNKACRDGFSVLYKRASRLFADLAQARGEGRLLRLMNTLERTNLIIIDDWGPEPLTADQRRDLLEIVDDRYDKGSPPDH